eukprot:9057999-Alexandrium_andersonii.AAC.1
MIGGAPDVPFDVGTLASAEQARLRFPYRAQEEQRARHFEQLEDERLKGTALETSRRYCATCFVA